MKVKFNLLINFLIISFTACSGTAAAQSPEAAWFLPKRLSDHNLVVGFDVDTTWHWVHGQTSGIDGEAMLSAPDDPQSVAIEVKIPVANFDTDSSSRDSELRNVMAADKYPFVILNASGLTKGCTPAKVLAEGSCEDAMAAKIQIRAIKSDFLLPILMKKTKEGFSVEGSFNIKWPDFGVEDPSILVARVHKDVTIKFKVTLRP
jgi:polyisoprenoid-binding protein YceI